MRKMLAVPLFAPLIAAVLVAGCGINPGPVVEDHAAKRAGPGDSSGAGGPAKREDRQLSDPIDVVEAFLTAAAAGSAPAREAIMRSYVAPGDPWKPAAEVKVVRVISTSKTNTAEGATVEVLAQHIGVLNDFGQLVPSDESIKKYEYRAVNLGQGYVLSAPPKDVLLSESGLSSYFVRRPLYFHSGAALVPDWRYMSTTLSLEQQSNRLVEWLYEGPSAWLGNAVKRLPPETRPGITQVVRNGDALVVDLSASPGDAEYLQLAQQLAKTLVVEPFTALQIKVQGQLKTARQTVPGEPKRFVPRRYALVDQRVRRLLVDGRGASPEDMLPPEIDKNVVAAAFSRGERAVAVVQQESGAQRLRIGPATKLVPVTGLPNRISRIGQPQWLDSDARTLLFIADGGIYQTGLDGKAELKATAPGLTSMSVAPDGRRLALVISGTLVLATRTESGTITLGPNQTYRVPTMFGTVQSVAFGVDNSLIVAGAHDAGTVLMLRMNLDGTQQSTFDDRWDSGSTIRHLVADPQSGNVLFELLGDAYEGRQNSSPKLAKEFAAPAPKVSAPSFEG